MIFRPREYVGTRRNPRNCFYVLVGRVWTLSVPARRLGALNEVSTLRQENPPKRPLLGKN